jgi:hypothetical protein
MRFCRSIGSQPLVSDREQKNRDSPTFHSPVPGHSLPLMTSSHSLVQIDTINQHIIRAITLAARTTRPTHTHRNINTARKFGHLHRHLLPDRAIRARQATLTATRRAHTLRPLERSTQSHADSRLSTGLAPATPPAQVELNCPRRGGPAHTSGDRDGVAARVGGAARGGRPHPDLAALDGTGLWADVAIAAIVGRGGRPGV